MQQQPPLGETASHRLQQVMALAQQGQLAQASANLKNASIQLEDSAFYQRLWLSLNHLHPLENESLYPTELDREVAYEYFSQTSHYRIINADLLMDADRIFLEESRLLAVNLQFIKIENLALEELYINTFNTSKYISKLSRIKEKRTDYKWSVLNPAHFQQSLIETGYIYTICPISSRVLRTNQSIYYLQMASNEPIIIYRFLGEEVFYLAVGGWSGGKIFAYFPRLELILHLCKDWSSWLPTTTIVNRLKADVTSKWKKVSSYIQNDQPKEVAAIVGCTTNLGHYIWNDLSGIEFLEKNQLLKLVDKFIITSKNRFDIFQIFSGIKPEKVLKINDNSQIFETILDHNYCAVRVTDSSIDTELADKIYRASVQNCNPEFLSCIEEAKTHFPLLWINLRSHNKSWVNQIEGYANIISKLSEDYPNLAVVFDGVPAEKPSLEQIQALIPASIKIYSAVDCTLYETIVWANAIDLYIAVIGSGLTLVTWLANKPGVAHSDRGHYAQIEDFWLEVRENIIEPLLVPIDAITDAPEEHRTGWLNYYCDWQEIYHQVIQVIKTLSSKASLGITD